jgi:TRAP transporter TAXI family solute receptor
MLRSGHGSLARWLAAFLCIGILSWLALEYLVPSPPSRITIATGPKGSTFEYFGKRYRARFARVGIDLELRQTVGALENLQLLQDPKSGVQIGFVTGGISDGRQAPELLSTGLIYNVPFWIFYPSSTTLDGLPQLKGKRIAVGPEGSGTRFTAERILSKANVTAKTATLVPLEGNAAIEALDDGKVDAVLIVGGSDAPAVRALLTNPRIRLMDFPTAEAFTRIFPDLVRLVLPKGAIEIDPPNPPNDVTLVGTTAKVLIRDDLHPAVVQLLARTMKEEHSGLGLFQRSGEFPSSFDPEYPMAQVAVDYYKNGPSFLAKYLPFWMTIYAQRLIAFSVAAIAIVFPAFSFAPRLYEWVLHTRLRALYRRLRVVENALHRNISASQIEALRNELADIDKTTSTVPMRNSDLYFMLRYHLNQTRSRLAEAGENAEVGRSGS